MAWRDGTVPGPALSFFAGGREIAQVCRSHDLWLHADAAWGGAAILSQRLKPHLKGISRADSITCDPHKWLSVNNSCGMFLCRHRSPVLRAFQVGTDYMPASTRGVVEPYLSSVNWSRRLAGLKVFMSLAELGKEGYERMIDHQTEMGDRLQRDLPRDGWTIVNQTPLPVVCFSHEKLRKPGSTVRILEELYRRGQVWISEVRLPRVDPTLRACITSYKTEIEDLQVLRTELQRALEVL